MTQKTRASPPGTCQVCRESHPHDGMTAHVAACIDRAVQESKGRPVDAFHVEAEGFNHTTGSLYWLQTLARAEATLFDLDKLLRETWLEPCCGHLSSFDLGGIRFEAYPDDEFGPPSKSMKDAPLADLLAAGKRFGHEYDFGSTTDVDLRVVARRVGAFKGRAKTRLLAISNSPALACSSCGKPAILVCAAGCTGKQAFACKGCAPNHGCGEEVLSTLVNSPRSGTCGFPTEPRQELGWTAAG